MVRRTHQPCGYSGTGSPGQASLEEGVALPGRPVSGRFRRFCCCLHQVSLTNRVTCSTTFSCSYYDAFAAFDNGNRVAHGAESATGMIFATYPNEFVTISGAFVDQVIGTALLMYAVLAVGDPKGQKIPAWLQPIYM